MPTRRICEYLDALSAKYALVKHSTAYTAQEVAESAHIPGRDLAKSVAVLIDGDLALAVVPATQSVDLRLLGSAADAIDVDVASEREFAPRFPECQVGAMPPLGVLYGIPTYVDRSLAREPYIAFAAGSHTDVIITAFDEYRRVASPTVAHLVRSPQEQPQLAALQI